MGKCRGRRTIFQGYSYSGVRCCGGSGKEWRGNGTPCPFQRRRRVRTIDSTQGRGPRHRMLPFSFHFLFSFANSRRRRTKNIERVLWYPAVSLGNTFLVLSKCSQRGCSFFGLQLRLRNPPPIQRNRKFWSPGCPRFKNFHLPQSEEIFFDV